MTQRVMCSLLIGIAVNGMSSTVHAQVTNPPAAAAEPKPGTPSQPPSKAPSVTQGGIIDAARQFNINGQRVLIFDANLNNLLVGGNAGANTTGGFNSFVGADAGIANIAGQYNSYFGARAGQGVQMGNFNAAFGFEAGTGGPGPDSTASENSFFGFQAGRNVYNGSRNVYVGAGVGLNGNNHMNNTAVGWHAGGAFGTVLLGSNGTFIGSNARPGADVLVNAAAIGANAQVDHDNSLVLGSINNVNGATADTNVGIGTTAPTDRLHVNGGNIRFGNSLLTTDQGGSIELGGTQTLAGTGSPYIDFHFNGLTQDASVRLINDSNGVLTVGGNLHVTGNIGVDGFVTKLGGNFRIDHPLDPENRYLYHSFVESPDMKNIYDGVVTLDETGAAVVQLPDWFEALNQDFRYQLTCMLGFAPVYIAEEITGNRFRIAGGVSGLKVSWQVTGIRHDAAANAHRIQVEEDKPRLTEPGRPGPEE